MVFFRQNRQVFHDERKPIIMVLHNELIEAIDVFFFGINGRQITLLIFRMQSYIFAQSTGGTTFLILDSRKDRTERRAQADKESR